MNRFWKVVLIIGGVVVAIPVLLFLGWLIFCSVFQHMDQKVENDYAKQAKINVTQYLEEKYQEKSFTIKGINVNSDGVILNTGCDSEVEVIITDGNENYSVWTDAEKTNKDGVLSCRDNVQNEEIKKAIADEFKNMLIVNGEQDNIKYEVEFFGWEYFTEKYEDDIVDFIKKDNKRKGEYDRLEIRLYCSYVNKEEQVSKDLSEYEEFFQLLDLIVLIDFEYNIPKFNYTWHYIDDIKFTFNENNTIVNSMYVYDKDLNAFVDVMKNAN